MVIQNMGDIMLKAPTLSSLDMVSDSKNLPKFKRTHLNIMTEISKDDLCELNIAYKKCKEVINKIESKYGYLLNKNDVLDEENQNLNTCTCKFNKKIVFNDDGQHITKDIVPDLHVCPKKPRYGSSSIPKYEPNILIEHDFDSLPSDLKDLCEILKDETINIGYRNKVIEKIKSIRLDDIKTMRFDRKILVENLKANPDYLFVFKGANLSSLTGYPVNTIQET